MFLKFLVFTFVLSLNTSFSDEGEFGLREEEANMAHKTLQSIRTNLDDAMRKVEDALYPNLQTYSIQTNLPISSTTILVDFIGYTPGKIPTNSRISLPPGAPPPGAPPPPPGAPPPPPAYRPNPYIARLAVIETGLHVQLKFVSAITGVNDNPVTTAKLPIFEPFYGKRIVMIPIFNVVYDSAGNVTTKDTEISTWECLSDADEGISTSGTTIAEGMRSVVSMGGGNLGACQFISSSNLDTIWANI
ncbi:hypothetical protein phytr_6350 [Candidatus Phycorickettsia trachydisci]|uniref:Uncharacterized protein n=1 Tax=Candidatus Phycorickettsia trachydisci TaxID=2115978 RepID=A0A2P1P8J7_9RICK|nr:hypothetical protein [Candidatus Phycorickettsia trachydisci]AVP87576.1 hypothetical protein phytr_6350 [Candidatus Phycorickettsia trachydisci]